MLYDGQDIGGPGLRGVPRLGILRSGNRYVIWEVVAIFDLNYLVRWILKFKRIQ